MQATGSAFEAARDVAERPGEVSAASDALPPLLSAIAGMVDLTGFFTLGNIFTAHVTGNLVLAAAAVVGGRPLGVAQALAIPVFMLAVAATWLVARALASQGLALVRQLLSVQFALLAAVLIFSVATKPSADPRGFAAGLAAMMAVCAMGCQYALIRLALSKVVSTAVMTGNLTNSVLALMDRLSPGRSMSPAAARRLIQSLRLLAGFLVGCLMAAATVSFLADWTWALPVALAALTIASVRRQRDL